MSSRKIAPVTAGFEALKPTSVHNAGRARDLQPPPGQGRCEWRHDSLNVANLPMAQKPMDAPSHGQRVREGGHDIPESTATEGTQSMSQREVNAMPVA